MSSFNAHISFEFSVNIGPVSIVRPHSTQTDSIYIYVTDQSLHVDLMLYFSP